MLARSVIDSLKGNEWFIQVFMTTDWVCRISIGWFLPTHNLIVGLDVCMCTNQKLEHSRTGHEYIPWFSAYGRQWIIVNAGTFSHHGEQHFSMATSSHHQVRDSSRLIGCMRSQHLQHLSSRAIILSIRLRSTFADRKFRQFLSTRPR